MQGAEGLHRLKETRIFKYIKGIVRNRKYMTTEEIMLMLERYYNLPINIPSVYYKYRKIIKMARQEVYKERRKKRKIGGDKGV